MATISISVEGLAVLAGRGLAQLGPLLRLGSFRDFLLTSGGVVAPASFFTSTVAERLDTARTAALGLNGLADAVEAATNDVDVIATGVSLVGGIGNTFDALDELRGALSTAPGLDATSAARLAALLPELPAFTARFALLRYLDTKLSGLSQLLSLLGVVEQERVESAPGRFQFERQTLHLGRIPQLLSNPGEVLSTVLGFGGTLSFAPGEKLFDRLELYLRNSGLVPLRILEPDGTISLESPRGTLKLHPTDPEALLHELGFDIPADMEVTGELRPGATVSVSTSGGIGFGTSIELRPPLALTLLLEGGQPSLSVEVAITLTPTDAPTFRLLGLTGGSFIEAEAVSFPFELRAPSGAAAEPSIGIRLERARTVIALGGGDGFVSSLLGGGKVEATFDFSARYQLSKGLSLEAGGLEFNLPLHVSFGGIEVEGFRVALPIGTDRPGVPVDFSTSVKAALGPFTLLVDRIGLATNLIFDGPSLRLGFADFSGDFLAPTGIGASIDGGSISGGGFLSRDEATGRYTGALELQVFSIGVKAFGLLDTRFPDGTEGVSFVVVIVAEFTPIQLGFGFTLIGIGGLLGLNRSVDAQALGDAVRTGSLEHLLFPRNPVQDAPAIIHDLGTVFPASRGHYIFGPMAKFGWGTPTLISADIGIVIEFPGPRLAVLGVARMQLPSPELALLRLQMAIAGLLDFPAKVFSLDAGLYDSTVAGFTVTGDMAYRLGFGSNAKFLLSIGGFNPSFDGPPGFPELRRASVELGLNGNPSLVASGYFALTSNTAQIGAKVELRASGFGIRLHGFLGFDALFVFAPFSFAASFSAGMRVSFHGAGIGVTLRGSLSGPSPWHIKGKVCVSVLFWDACLSVDHTFGTNRPAALPEIDPWLGTPESTDARVAVIGLRAAIEDSRNWSGSNPPAGFSVVSLTGAATSARTPLDPLGAATLRQKVVPLETEIQKFGEYRPFVHDRFFRSSVTLIGAGPGEPVDVSKLEDDFAPAKFFDLSDADKLSMDSYVPMEAGFTVNTDRVAIGSAGSQVLTYETDFITAEGETFEDPNVYVLTRTQLLGMLKRSASALGGIRRAGAQRYIVPTRPRKVTFGPKRFVVVDSCSSVRNDAITGTGVSQIQAFMALRGHVLANPSERDRYTIAPEFAAL